MSILGSILGSIFGTDNNSAATSASTAGSPATTGATGTRSSAAGGMVKPAQAGSVDVEAILNRMAAGRKGETLNWRKSIVDLMKLLDLDSSSKSRKALAAELHYTGDTNDSAAMNMWLHKQVMQKLAENGGKVPDSLKD